MHCFILVGDNLSDQQNQLDRLFDSSWIRLNYEANNIEQVRQIIKFSNLSVTQNTVIIVTGLGDASLEAQNSFLKSIEEPQDNLKFVILVNSEANLVDTIRSRAQIIYLKPRKVKVNEQYENFNNLEIGQKFEIISKIKKRDEAIEFIKNLIYVEHDKLKNGQNNKQILEKAMRALNALQKNGNVGLQLTNFIINSSSK